MLLELISSLTLLEKEYILHIAQTSSSRYKKFYIKKNNGSLRTIYHPSKELKGIQRVIHNELLLNLPIHPASAAYNKGCSIKSNAEQHKKSKYLLRVDFKNFFESISKMDISNFAKDNIFTEIENWSDKDTELLVDLATLNGGLTIGSITSPLLSNVICYKLDVALFSLSHKLGVTYTRYADDLYFSTNHRGILKLIPSQVDTIIKELKYPKNLKVNHNKTKHSSKKNRMMVTGLILTNDFKVSIGHSKKREIRSKIYKWSSLSLEEKLHLSGYLSYIKFIEPSFINTLCCKYGAEDIQNIIKYNSNT